MPQRDRDLAGLDRRIAQASAQGNSAHVLDLERQALSQAQQLHGEPGRADNAGAQLERTVYALEHCAESEFGAALFTTLSAEGEHSIVGTLESTDPDIFLDAVCACEAGKSRRFFNAQVSSQQPSLYAALKKA